MITNLPASLRGRAIKENVDMDELISKRAVIEAIEKARANVGHNLERSIGKSIIEILDDVGRDVDRLPPALGTNLAEVGTDCISRQAAIDIIEDFPHGDVWNVESMEEMVYRIKLLPPAQPKRGKWIYCEDSTEDCVDGYRCDQCGFFAPWDYKHKGIDYIQDYNFCPKCGAKMEVTT